MSRVATALPRSTKQIITIVVDFLSLFFAVWGAYCLRLGYWYEPSAEQFALFLLAPVIAAPIFVINGLYRSVIRYVGEQALLAIVKSMGIATLLWTGVAFMTEMRGLEGVPRSVPLLYFMLATGFVAATRFGARWLLWLPLRKRFSNEQILIYGAVKREAPIPASKLDVIVTVEGPSTPLIIRKKDRVAGIWINRERVRIDAAPSFYAVATTGPLSTILSETDNLRHRITIPRAVRAVADPATSYTARLIGEGRKRLAQKVGEEGLEKGIRVKTSSYTRHHVNSTMPRAKLSGTYPNSILANLEVTRMGYDEALLLDNQGFVAEGAGENVFIVKNGKLYTLRGKCFGSYGCPSRVYGSTVAAPIWAKLGVEPVPLNELLERSDAVSLQVVYASRFRGWINERLLNHCKPGQLWVGVSRSSLFDPEALALALTDGRIDACLLDGANPAFAAEGTPLYNVPNLHLTPRLGSHTREAKLRASWYVAHRIHETLSPMVAQAEARVSDFSVLDSLDYQEQSDPQAVTPSQWSSIAMHRG